MDIKYIRTLDYNDGIQIFEAQDSLGETYIACLVEVKREADIYLLSKCGAKELLSFNKSEIDLRDLFRNSEPNGWYLAGVTDFDEPLNLNVPSMESIPEKYLPKLGFFTTGPEIEY